MIDHLERDLINHHLVDVIASIMVYLDFGVCLDLIWFISNVEM